MLNSIGHGYILLSLGSLIFVMELSDCISKKHNEKNEKQNKTHVEMKVDHILSNNTATFIIFK